MNGTLVNMRTLALLTLAMTAVVGACGADSQPPSSTWDRDSLEVQRGLPDEVTGRMDSPAGAGVDGDHLLVVTYGSSSNPRVITELTVDGQTVTVTLKGKDGVPATMDYMPTTSRTRLPESVATDEPITVVLEGFGNVEVAENPGFSWIESLEN